LILLQTGDWVVLLEGICRFGITGLAGSHEHDHGSVHGSTGSIHGSSKSSVGQPGAAAAAAAGGAVPGTPYDFVTIHQLELLPHAHFGSNGSSSSSSSSNGGLALPGDTNSSGSSTHPSFKTGRPLLPIDTGLHNPGQGLTDAINSSSSSSSSSGGGSVDDIEQLGAALKSSTKVLLQMLSAASGLPAARRLLELLAGVPAWRAADVVAAALARTNQV
jgi:hypothetical protein